LPFGELILSLIQLNFYCFEDYCFNSLKISVRYKIEFKVLPEMRKVEVGSKQISQCKSKASKEVYRVKNFSIFVN
jgi:hypothetical protein